MKKTLSLILALLMVMMFSTGTVLAKPNNLEKNIQVQTNNAKQNQGKNHFTDISQHWANQSINDMAVKGLFKGYPDGTFKPDQQLTQAEAVTLLMQICKEDITDTSINNEENTQLANVPAWARKDAGKAAKKGIINLNRFHSAEQASRTQTAVMIAKALGLKPVDIGTMPFKDGILISKEDVGYILALYQEGIITGSPNGNFNPNSAITRAEMASILQRILQKLATEVTVTPATVSIVQGGTQQLTATIDAVAQTVNWTSSDTTNKVAVDANGLVTVAADATFGNYIITATSTVDCSKTGTSTITVAAVTGIGAITGTAQVGQTLASGALTPAGTTATYQWLKCTTSNGTYTAISGATSSTYTPQAADVNYYIEVLAAGSVTSACTGPVIVAPINIPTIVGVTAPVNGATPVTTIPETAQYTGTVTWAPADETFGASTEYTATIKMAPRTGFTLTGVTADFFTVAGATATNGADSGVITAKFPAI
jgi:hypothetical protein